jgi:basic membrane protein A
MRHSRLRWFGLAASLLTLVALLAACGGSGTGSGSPTATPAKVIKVGLVTDIGGLNDKGFNHLAYVGLTNAEQQLGIKGDVTESHTGDDYVPNLTNYATKGYDLVIAVGFLMGPAVGQVSQQFPNTKFAIIDSDPTDANGNSVTRSNVEALFFREQQAGALVGAIAGQLEKDKADPKKSNTVSAVGGISIPPVNRYIAGYKWAVQQLDPGAKVLVGYSNNFTAPDKCAGVASDQINAGADIVFQVAGGCGLGALQAAGQKGDYSIGVDTDQKAADNSVIASAVKHVEVATFTAIKQVQTGTFTSGETQFDLSNGGVGYAPGNVSLPADVVQAEATMESQIKSGALTPPTTIP